MPSASLPHLSHSRVSRYLTCPQQYEYYYVHGMRPEIPPASLEFGKAVHQAIAIGFSAGKDPVHEFNSVWTESENKELDFGFRGSWSALKERGTAVIQKFWTEERSKITEIESVEEPFNLHLSNLAVPLTGTIDLLGTIHGKKTIVDFKTSSAAYADYDVALADQLTAYQLAVPEAEQVAYCVLQKTKEPKVQWHFSARSSSNLQAYIHKLELVAEDIAAEKFYQRSGKHCGYCPFLSQCTSRQN